MYCLTDIANRVDRWTRGCIQRWSMSGLFMRPVCVDIQGSLSLKYFSQYEQCSPDVSAWSCTWACKEFLFLKSFPHYEHTPEHTPPFLEVFLLYKRPINPLWHYINMLFHWYKIVARSIKIVNSVYDRYLFSFVCDIIVDWYYQETTTGNETHNSFCIYVIIML